MHARSKSVQTPAEGEQAQSTDMTSLFIQIGCVTVNSTSDKKIKNKKSFGRLCYTCFLPFSPFSSVLHLVELQAGLDAEIQTLLMHTIHHRGSGAWHPGPFTPLPVINHRSRGTLSQEWPEIRSVLWHKARDALAQFLRHLVGPFDSH